MLQSQMLVCKFSTSYDIVGWGAIQVNIYISYANVDIGKRASHIIRHFVIGRQQAD